MTHVVWFPNDTELTQGEACLEVSASALELSPDLCPDQMVLNGYGYDVEAPGRGYVLYKRQHDGALLKVLDDLKEEA